MTEIVDHHDGIIRDLDRPPVIMGHSFGGLVTELLLDRGPGARRGHLSGACQGRLPAAAGPAAGRLTGGAPGWEEVADYALDWANRHTGVSAG